MTKKNTNSSILIPTWVVSLVLLGVIYLMFSSSFTFDYLMNDEMTSIGSQTEPLEAFVSEFYRVGRSLHGIYHSLTYSFIDYDPIKVQFVRFVNFASFAAIGLVLFRFLRLSSKSIFLSFFTILFLFSQLAFQAHFGYSLQLFLNSQPSMWLSLSAFYLHFYFFPKRQVAPWISYTAVFILFIAAMQSTQTYAYFAMVPLSFLVLTNDKKHNKQVLVFFALALASFILSTLLYKVGLEINKTDAYKLGEKGIESLTSSPLKVLGVALNPQAYWSAFKVWTYPYPFHYTLPLGGLKQLMAQFIMMVWFILIVSSIVIEFSQSQQEKKRKILLKWLWALICLSFGALFIIADNPLQVSDHRPHVTITFVGVCIFTGAYALQVLASHYSVFRTSFVKTIGGFLVVLTAFGAQSGLLKGIVNVRENESNFIRTELSAKSPKAFSKIIVVLSRSSRCITEPCDPWFGEFVQSKSRQRNESRYIYLLRTLGISPESKEIIFVDDYPKQVAKDELIINWQKYLSAHQQHLNYLKQNNQ